VSLKLFGTINSVKVADICAVMAKEDTKDMGGYIIICHVGLLFLMVNPFSKTSVLIKPLS